MSSGRKGTGGLKAHDPASASPVGHGWAETAVVEREDEVSVAIATIVDSLDVADATATPVASSPEVTQASEPEGLSG